MKCDETTIAVLMTCYNRRETTLNGLRSLFAQEMPPGHRLRVLLTDDGSTDGTGAAVRAEFPQVEILQGNGSLYWVGGMQLAWRAARPADFYFWFNDDVALKPGAIVQLFDVYRGSGNPQTIVVGATCDPDDSRKTCTGGMKRRSWHNAHVMEPNGQIQMCDAINGNIVLVPRPTEERIGMMDDRYTHFFADADYGLRARKHGIPVLLAPEHLGVCRRNSLNNTVFDSTLPVLARWRRFFGPKGHRPPDQWWTFVKAHAPRPKALYWAIPYVLFWVEAIFGSKIRIRRDVQAHANMLEPKSAT
jgi:GT2 family glycosyltransferase